MDTNTFNYMYAVDTEEIADLWRTYKGYTVRPLQSTERYYDTIIRKYCPPSKRAAVLGATPEIRTLLQMQDVPTLVIDRSMAMIQAMNLLTPAKFQHAPNETPVVSNWLQTPVESESVDLVLADDSINMLNWNQFPKFLSESAKMLKPGGLFACHLLVKPDDAYIDATLSDVVRGFQDGRIVSHFDFASCVNFTQYDRTTFQMGWQRSLNAIRKAIDSGEIQDDHDFARTFAKCNSEFTCPPRNEFEILLENSFVIQDVLFPLEHSYCQFEPLYVLRKKI